MITLIQFPHAKNQPSYSPFCLKLETHFKIANVPYENKYTVSMKDSKKKKMPMIVDQGELIEDSDFIIHHLKLKHSVDLDKHLSAEEKAIAKAFQLLCEKSIVDIVMYFRWVDKENWPKFRDIVFRGAPWFIKVTIANGMAKSIEKTLYKHGIGRFTEAEKLKILDDNLTAISNYLGSKKYFFGDQVSSIDVILFSTLIQVNARGAVRQFEQILNSYPNLKNYLERFRQTYWPEMNV
jgi:glutathione S-transferase